MPLTEINPYTPTDSDSTGADDRSLCPVCAQRVEFARYVFPFGFCPGCGNYLAVRNWNGKSTLWAVPIAFVVLASVVADVFWNLDLDDWILPSFIAVFALVFLHGRIFGKLVPAVCWGFFAVPDDDRNDEATS
ncbi:hypothetical protein [Rhodopirellula sp. MGV]|uniref:hypothetical protein n=1 Tax=Rhodopirellula sp. MGV TaxID=2023130 RepID=UPI000B96E212|nr:hypothetical protein [Rhodopirellula sp. MGV]OYP33955.1 hypothetical protein CGZ80_17420 [Rhodopirellula sp. MGV]PNY34062.1 hypothetical protein C2E31_24975 [Rhodopirellula baltica]